MKFLRKYSPNPWFSLHENVNVLWIPIVSNHYVPDSDIIFATAWITAKCVLKLNQSKGIKFYFIQSLETWWGHEKEVVETWKYPMNKIVISQWLANYANQLGEKCTYIPNGLNFNEFGLDIDINKKPHKSILMLYHILEVKGTMYGLEGIYKLKEIYHDITFNLFGVESRRRGLPDWIIYHYRPNKQKLRELCNKSSIFISPSIFEGFPLPPAEAMMCGCALVATDIGGHKEYCIDKKTALLVPIKSSISIFEKTELLIQNNLLRIKIAENGNEFIKRFTWESTINRMENTLKEF